jgi:glycosyltransferase involved in cell wall biosynthesis
MSMSPLLPGEQGTGHSVRPWETPLSEADSRTSFRSRADISLRETSYPIIAHCHLCWDWVWQRPQQFLSRLSRSHPVLYVETHPPAAELDQPRVAIRSIVQDQPGDLTVLALQIPASRWHDGAFIDLERRRLVQEALAGPLARRFDCPVQWFYDPMAVTAFAGQLGEQAIVYDCMDELSQFRGAPREIVERERSLLAIADVVFTGGRKLWESKRQLNGNCHFYGCGVEVDHFNRALNPELPIPADVAGVSKPVLGYFGVVDERLDYELIEKLATAHPDWNFVMVGPAAKVAPGSLPQRRNIHWLGGRPYTELPAYARYFDVCLMPFALNEATEYINPTKALEYMATGRPVVSTAVADVISNFSDVVHIARSPNEFEELCRRGIESRDEVRIGKGLAMTRENTWERIVSRLESHVHDVLSRRKGNGSARRLIRESAGALAGAEPCVPCGKTRNGEHYV